MTQQTNPETSPSEPVLTAEEVNRHYSSTLDSVEVINKLIKEKPTYMSDEDRKDSISRNAEHLKIMQGKKFWASSHDMKPIAECISAADKFLK